MTNFIKILCALSFTAAAACSSGGNSTSGTTGGAGTTGGTTTGGGIPAVPALGTHEIDRMGRPAVNTALTAPLNVFTLPDGGTIAEPAAKDLYNQSSDQTMWTAQFQAAFAGSLAVYDGLDGVCSNQVLAGLPDAGGNLAAYGTLATVLTDDEIYVDTTVSTCAQYLAVELETVGIIPATSPKDCGGRTPLENVMDETYSALAAGALSGVSNGVTAKAGNQANLTTFPFLGAPQ